MLRCSGNTTLTPDMATERHLSNAPIREAVLDLRVPMRDATATPDDLRAALLSLADFSDIHEMQQRSITFRFPSEGEPEGSAEPGDVIGFRGTSDDGLSVTQFRLDGVTFSLLPPYPNWAEFSERARHFVEEFLEVTQPPYVERLALRYINHFRLPYPIDMKDYFVGLPSVPATLPQFVSNLLSRATIHDPETDFSAHITHSLLDDPDPERMGFLLGIDTFRTAEFPMEEAPFWETFERLKDFKNAIFFELITERNAEFHE